MSRKSVQRIPGSMEWVNGRRAERMADGWTDMEVQTVIFTTLQTLLKMRIFQILMNYALCDIRIFLYEFKT
jgi:hypothetical protein